MTETLAKELFDHCFLDSKLFEEVCKIYPETAMDISYDWHDNSLEIMFSGDVAPDWEVPAIDVVKLAPLGFTMFWFNFVDDTIQTACISALDGETRVGNRRPGRSKANGRSPERQLLQSRLTILERKYAALVIENAKLKGML